MDVTDREALKLDLKKMIIEATGLEDVSPEDIGDSDPLFVDGLGLDSIDALELVVALETRYHIKIADAALARKVFASIESLALHVETHAP